MVKAPASSLREVHAEGRSGRASQRVMEGGGANGREVGHLVITHVTAALYDRGATWAGL